jgi:hypothetical protein
MTKYQQLIEKMDLNDAEFKSDIEIILDEIISSPANADIEVLSIYLDWILNLSKLLNQQSTMINVERDFYFSEDFINVFNNGICESEHLDEAYHILSTVLSTVEDVDQPVLLKFAFFEAFFKYKAKKDQKEYSKLASEITAMLRYKNHIYGDAALNPTPFFTSTDPLTLISIQLNNKVMRILSSQNKEEELEDAALDIIGYFVLFIIYYEKNNV